MPAKPIQISLDAELLERIDNDPEAQERGRSALIRSAVEVYLRAKERKSIEKKIVEAYGGSKDDIAAEIQDLIWSASVARRLNRGEIWLLDLPRPIYGHRSLY